MNTEQLRAEFEALNLYKDCDLSRCRMEPSDYANTYVHYAWEGYQAAAKSRDELIGKLYHALKVAQHGVGQALQDEALAEAKAQGYGE